MQARRCQNRDPTKRGADLTEGLTDRAERDRERISKLTALVNGAGRLGIDVRGEAAGERKGPDELLEAGPVGRVLRVKLGDGAFEIEASESRGRAVAGAGDKEEAGGRVGESVEGDNGARRGGERTPCRARR